MRWMSNPHPLASYLRMGGVVDQELFTFMNISKERTV
jgi:hypothetical protein